MRGFEPGLIGMRNAHPRIDALQTVHRGVHLGDEDRLMAGLLRVARSLENRVVVSEMGAGRCPRREGEGTGPAGVVAERVRGYARSVPGHPKAGQARAEAAAAGGGSLPRVETLAKRRRIIRYSRRRRARTPYFVACCSQHG